MPRLIDGIVVDDDSTSTARVSMDEGAPPAANSPSPLHGVATCVEHGDIAGCVHLSGVRTRAEDDLSNPRHPDFARKFCKTITSKQETRELIREVAKEKHGQVVKKSAPPRYQELSVWRKVVMWGDDMSNPEPQPGDNCYQKSRKWLAVQLEKKRIAIFLVVLLLLDLACLSVEIVLQELYRDVHGEKAHRMEEIEQALRAVSITILGIFALEIAALLYAFNLYFFTKPFYVLDMLVIGMSLFAEIYLRNVLAAGLLVLLRGWRLVRIFHGVYSIGQEAKEDMAHKLHDAAHALLETHWELQEVLRENRALRKRIKKHHHPSPTGIVELKAGTVSATAALPITPDTDVEPVAASHKKDKKKHKHKERVAEPVGPDAV